MLGSDLILFEKLKKGDEKAFVTLYDRYKTELAGWLKNKFGISEEDAREIFQLTMVTFYENVINKKITELSSALKTYLFAIAKNKALELMRKKGSVTSLTNMVNVEDEESFDLMEEEVSTDKDDRYIAMQAGLEKLGSPCSEILVSFYFRKMSLTEIGEQYGYKNEKSIKSQKFKCMERLRRIYFELHQENG